MTIQTILLQAQGAGFQQFLFPIVLIAILYFFMIRPQMVKQKKEKKFQETIKQGAKIVTTSGIHGKITEINDTNNTIVVETGAGKIRFERSAISMAMSQKHTPTTDKK